MSDLVWVTDRCYIILGSVFRILTQNSQMAHKIDEVLSGFEATDRPARAVHILQVTGTADEAHRLYRSCQRIGRKGSAGDLIPTLLAAINEAAIEACPHFAVHAAVVSNQGNAIALPADSGGGKSTLAAASVMTGLSYLSDEALVFDESGKVVPYPKPISLADWSCSALGIPSAGTDTLVTPRELGGSTHSGPADLTDVVIARFGESPLTLERRPPSEAVSALLGKSFNHYKDPRRAFFLATEVARESRVWSLRYSDPLEAAQRLRDCLE